MPQVFQVLRCYKCSIFQVHQTKKDNKWKCKVCGEKQSVKRHYNIGTAKDCRIHVQKLNHMQGDVMEALQLKADSDSEYEDNTENGNKINKTQVLTNNAKKESKWSAYIEKEEIPEAKEPEYIDNVEVCLELSQKRKKNRKTKAFKVPEISNKDCNEKTDIINNLSTFDRDKSNSFNLKDNSISMYYGESSVRNHLERRKKNDVNKSANFQTNKSSKWAQYEYSENGDHFGNIENDKNDTKESIEYYDNYKAESVEFNNRKKEEETEYNGAQKLKKDGSDQRNHCQKTENDIHPIPNKPIFSLCDDNDLDNILDF